MKRLVSLGLAMLVMTGTLGACSTPAIQDGNTETTSGTMKVAMATEPISMDPHVGNDSNTGTALMLGFEGLLNLVDGEVVPGMAESYEVSEDGLTWTFNIRDAAWSDGIAVKASDFSDTYKRMLTRQDAMDLAYLIFPIKNAQPISEGSKAVSELGVNVVDEKTLEITLEAPYPFMKSLFAFCSLYPIRSDLADEYGNEYGSAPDKMAYNGPYLLEEWTHGDKMVFAKNENYYDKDSIKTEKVELILVADNNTMKNMYDTGEINFMEIPSDMMSSYENAAGFEPFNTGGVTFIALSHKGTSEEAAKIIQNRNFVMALSSAIDREDFVKSMFPTHSPFTGVINPVISDGMGGKWGDHQKLNVKDKHHKTKADLEAAKAYMDKALEELGYVSVDELPVFDFMNTSKEIDRTVSEYFQDVWVTNLGIKINIRQLDFAQYYENLYGAPYDICRTGWGPDYDDPFTYLDMWDSRGGWNKTGWVGENYYTKLMEANKQSDMQTRNDMFLEAEEILLTEAPIIPLYASGSGYIINDKITGVTVNTFGARFDFRYANLS